MTRQPLRESVLLFVTLYQDQLISYNSIYFYTVIDVLTTLQLMLSHSSGEERDAQSINLIVLP